MVLAFVSAADPLFLQQDPAAAIWQIQPPAATMAGCSESSFLSPASSDGFPLATERFFSCQNRVWFNEAETTVHPISPCGRPALGPWSQGGEGPLRRTPPPPPPSRKEQLSVPRPPPGQPTGRALLAQPGVSQSRKAAEYSALWIDPKAAAGYSLTSPATMAVRVVQVVAGGGRVAVDPETVCRLARAGPVETAAMPT
ncbi:unnamed protein product [Polarella glacialis]|uniref:Uncharacterized protein n=1 Tax=Polarella glacialis TaxID=89957 RepID=A0A813FIS6_POLGL|nr:unnamed protein product [Polarella glacialis]